MIEIGSSFVRGFRKFKLVQCFHQLAYRPVELGDVATGRTYGDVFFYKTVGYVFPVLTLGKHDDAGFV